MEKPPVTRGDCRDGRRPCPWVRCRYHLAGDAGGDTGDTCALDLAELGGMKLVEVGAVLGVTRQRVEQIERVALAKLRHRLAPLEISGADFANPEGGQLLEDDTE